MTGRTIQSRDGTIRTDEETSTAMAENNSLTSSSAMCQTTSARPRRALCHGQSVATVMDLPSSRELELEALLRKKDSQLAELTVCSLDWHLISCSLITLSWRCVRRTRSTPSASISRPSLIPLLPSPRLYRPHSYLCS